MIERYTLPEMGAIWSEQNKFQKWLDFEIVVCEALAELGEIPKDAVERIRDNAAFEVERINEIEKTTDHDVIAFLTNVADYIGDDSRYVHLGLTSSDLLDTTLSLQLKEAGELLLRHLEALRKVVKKRAIEHKRTIMIGRTHGIHAEPTTFGLKLLMWYDELGRRQGALERSVDLVSYGKVSGSVGNYAHLDPRVEELVMKKLGLKPAPVSSQIVQRDRHAEFVSALALVAATIEKMAIEVRGLQRTEVLEVEEFFKKGQKGSSSMPHKRNPILSERMCGMARLIRGYAVVAMENVALWHERDISHSSAERVILPDATITLHYMLVKWTKLMDNLLVYPERMMENLERTHGLIYSQRLLLELAKAGLSREDSYKLVQEAAMETWKTGTPLEKTVRARDGITSRIDENVLRAVFTLDMFVKNVDTIFERLV
ncbi:MAG: adenylosuccinate lyase [Candidatus Krumholzibacteria bacterium]|nr:adenylosuccinate lyase [Candidatus Krumholzibacteria bacterium]